MDGYSDLLSDQHKPCSWRKWTYTQAADIGVGRDGCDALELVGRVGRGRYGHRRIAPEALH